MFYTRMILKFFNFTRKKCVNRDIFCQKLRMEDVLLIYFEQIVSFCAINYSNTNSLSLHCEISRLNLANFTERLIFCVNLLDILPKKYFTQVSLVTNSMSARTLLSFCKCSLFTLHTKAQISIFGQPDSFVRC